MDVRTLFVVAPLLAACTPADAPPITSADAIATTVPRPCMRQAPIAPERLDAGVPDMPRRDAAVVDARTVDASPTDAFVWRCDRVCWCRGRARADGPCDEPPPRWPDARGDR